MSMLEKNDKPTYFCHPRILSYLLKTGTEWENKLEEKENGLGFPASKIG